MNLVIKERMYSVSEVAELSGHTVRYVHALIRAGVLEAIQPTSRNGTKSQWRIYPESIRAWLGVAGPRSERSKTRQEQAEIEAFEAITQREAR